MCEHVKNHSSLGIVLHIALIVNIPSQNMFLIERFVLPNVTVCLADQSLCAARNCDFYAHTTDKLAGHDVAASYI